MIFLQDRETRTERYFKESHKKYFTLQLITYIFFMLLCHCFIYTIRYLYILLNYISDFLH